MRKILQCKQSFLILYSRSHFPICALFFKLVLLSIQKSLDENAQFQYMEALTTRSSSSTHVHVVHTFSPFLTNFTTNVDTITESNKKDMSLPLYTFNTFLYCVIFTIHFPSLGNNTTTIRLLGLLIKHLTLRRQIITPIHKIIQLNPPLQNRINSLVQNLRCIVQILLNLGNLIRSSRILVFRKVPLQRLKGHGVRLCCIAPGVSGHVCEVV
jgi:hypothetical protein